MDARQHVVIVGGGLAGARTAEALRSQGFSGAVTLVAGEHHLPYERPPLSKGYLMGDAPFEDAIVHPRRWYTQHDVDVRVGVRATALDLAARTVHLDNGESLGYDKLVLATGSQVRRLAIPGADADGVHSLRTVEDADAIRAELGPGRRLVLIGGGWIGLEVAVAAREEGTHVTVLEAAELPLLGALGPEVAQVFADLHREHGVDLRTRAGVAAITVEEGRASGVRLEDGETIDADAVVVGVGVLPDTSLAEAAGLAVENGVLVDGTLRTSDPHVYAVGDIANHEHPVLGRRVRVEHWNAAHTQPATAAAAVLGGSEPYRELPYFFSDQYDLSCEFVGHVPRGVQAEVVVRGDLPGRRFVALWLDADCHLLAAMNVNVRDVVGRVRTLIAEHRAIDPDAVLDDLTPP